jgi:hypothetical protein
MYSGREARWTKILSHRHSSSSASGARVGGSFRNAADLGINSSRQNTRAQSPIYEQCSSSLGHGLPYFLAALTWRRCEARRGIKESLPPANPKYPRYSYFCRICRLREADKATFTCGLPACDKFSVLGLMLAFVFARRTSKQ